MRNIGPVVTGKGYKVSFYCSAANKLNMPIVSPL